MTDNRRRRTLRRRVQLRDRRDCEVRTWFDYESDEWVVTVRADEDSTEVRAPTLAEASSSAAEVLEQHELSQS